MYIYIYIYVYIYIYKCIYIYIYIYMYIYIYISNSLIHKTGFNFLILMQYQLQVNYSVISTASSGYYQTVLRLLRPHKES